MTFPSTHPALARALAARDYSVPTAVQLAVLEAEAAERDLLVSAQTGSGKTVAFGLAMATTLLGDAERLEQAGAPMALIVAPTRELAMQVQRELDWLYAETGARVITCVGGMDARAEARQLNYGAHIVVGTPGRLRDHLERNRLDLSQLKAIVLDEADEMLDLGFREDLEFILDATPESRRTLLFSATMPREIEAMATRYQREAVRIETLRRNEQHADIEYRAIRVAPKDIENAVVNVLRFNEARATIVFCATREAVKRMHARLVERGFSAVALSGELTQDERSRALQALRDGRARVLVATDVAARGLDLPDLSLVIHADLPNDHETLLHRSGRTGRAGKKGLCILIVPFNRRRKADGLLNAARLKVTWAPAPTADEIRARDQERFIEESIFTDAVTEDEQGVLQALQGARTAEQIALALVRMHRAGLPAPEDLMPDRGPPPRSERPRDGRLYEGRRWENRDGDTRRPERDRDRDRGAMRNRDEQRPPRSPRPARQDDRDMVWFRLNIGRERNADPRWLVPLICKAGGVIKAEIGSIKIFDRDTRFQIVADQADSFADAVRTNKDKQGQITRVSSHNSGDDVAVAAAIDGIAAPAAATAPDAGERRAEAEPRQRDRDRPSRERGARPERSSRPEWTSRSDRSSRSERSPRADWKPRSERGADGERTSPSERGSPAERSAAHERPKKPWRDRAGGAGKEGPRPHRKGGNGGKEHFGSGRTDRERPNRDRPQRDRADAAPAGVRHSKYAQKRNSRPRPASSET